MTIMTGLIPSAEGEGKANDDKGDLQDRFYRERHRVAISIARKFLLADMVPIIEGGWDEEEGRCHGPGCTLEYLLWGSKHSKYIKDFERFCTRVGDIRDRAHDWFDFNGFLDLKRSDTGFGMFMDRYVKAVVDGRLHGWLDLRFLMPWVVGMRLQRKLLPAVCEEALANDSWSALNILRDIGVMKLTKPVVRDILRSDNAGNIAERLMLEDGIIWRFFSPRDAFLLLCAACPNDAKCVRLGRILIEKDPNACCTPDINGYTPLIYTLFAHRRPFMSSHNCFLNRRRCDFERLLLANGCDPDHEDRFGLSWRTLEPAAKNFIACW